MRDDEVRIIDEFVDEITSELNENEKAITEIDTHMSVVYKMAGS